MQRGDSIQLVAPHLSHWVFPNRSSAWRRDVGTIGVLNLRFLPEPSRWLLLAAGVSLLVVLYRVRKAGSA